MHSDLIPRFSLFDDFVTVSIEELRNHFTSMVVLVSQGDNPQMADTVFQVLYFIKKQKLLRDMVLIKQK
tara:strand:- start:559 stop:765 length:207 start_codon:yes stop_codon:yes gene_type:complete